EVNTAIPAAVPMYTWNLAGYERGHAPSGGRNRHAFGGLTDAAFRMIPLLERGRDAAWPWE
ncbi:TROVE domain-containing protein, partial [Streptomyces sp. SID11233]|nr:TROVE domain-containing protein [Streptomyces sp. SID11233]